MWTSGDKRINKLEQENKRTKNQISKTMSRYFLVLIVCLLSYCVNGQQIVQKVYKFNVANGYNCIYDFAKSAESFYFIANQGINFTHYYSIIKTDTFLNTLWIKEFTTTAGEITINQVIALSNDSLIINGNYSYNNKNYCWLAKTDSALNIVSFRCLDIPNFEYSQAQLCNGDVVVYGTQRFDDTITHRKIFLIAMDTELNIKWKNQIQYLDGNDKIKIAEYPGDGLVVQAQAYITFSTPTVPGLNTFIVRIDSTGNVIWAKRTGTFGPSPSTIPYLYSGDVKVDHQGNIISSFQSTYWSILDFDNVLQKLDPQGNEIACKRFANVSGQDALVDNISIRPDGNIIQLMNKREHVITDANLNFLNRRRLSTSPIGVFWNQLIDENNQIINSGATLSPYEYGLVVKSDSSSAIGCGNNPYLSISVQSVLFSNTDITGDIILSNFMTADTTIYLSPNNVSDISDSVICNSATQFQELEFRDIKIYPTIVDDVLNIGYTNGDGATIEVINTMGSVLMKLPIRRSISVKELSKGIYFIKLIKDNDFITCKFIKQ